MIEYLLVLFVFMIFGIWHLATSKDSFKRIFTSKFSLSLSSYTLIRIPVSLLLLGLTLYFVFLYRKTTPELFTPIKGLIRIVPPLIAMWLSSYVTLQISKADRLPQYFGVMDTPKVFFYEGAYSICRHPLYFSWLLAVWGFIIASPYLLYLEFAILITIFVVHMSKEEEKVMIALFGERYVDYTKRVPFLLPYGLLNKTTNMKNYPK
ncbi:MAG: methyltransferase [Methanofastidiosum sp.]|nr:methyltransferase [Methanofastidiosum sp.]